MDQVRFYHKRLQKRLQENTPLLQVLLGPRQVGKTTSAQSIYNNWSGAKLMVSADSPSPPTAEWIRFQWQQAENLAPDALLIIDEVQKIPGWSEQVKILFDQKRSQKHLRVLLLGSSSLNLQKGLSESLAGRFELTQATHWTFAECRKAFDWDLVTFLKFGGYPGARKFIKDEDRWRDYILNSIIEPVLGRDILSQTRIDKPALFRQCFELCMQYPAQEVSLNKLLGQLQDHGNATTVRHYLDLFERCFLIRVLQKFSGSALTIRTSSPKIVVLNTALIHAYQTTQRIETDLSWYGRLFESLIGAQLSSVPNSHLYYWREGKFEVDFVLKTPKELFAIEVKSGIRSGHTKGLEVFAKKYPKAKCQVWDAKQSTSFLLNQTNPFL